MTLIETAEQLASAIIDSPRYVAECLERLHRFGGQVKGCNVLIHSHEVAWAVRNERPHVQTWALLHDAHELITGEIVRPAKSWVSEQLQNEIDDYLIAALGLNLTVDDRRIVHQADIMCGWSELKHLEKTIYQTERADCVDLFATRLQVHCSVLSATGVIQ